MRVLHVSHTAQPGGSNGVLLSLLRHAPPGVANACVFLEDGPVLGAAEALGVPVALVQSGRARDLRRAPGVIRALRSAARAHRAELLFAHVSKAQVYAWPAARLEGAATMWWQQEHLGLARPLQEVAGRLHADAVICSADWTAKAQREHFRGSRILRVHLGSEPPGESSIREHRAGSGERVVLGTVGRLQRWKRVELAIAALPQILAEEPGVVLRVIGGAGEGLDEDYPGELRAEAERLGVASAVEFAGHVPDGASRIADLDLLVHTARLEPFGLVLVEAMQRGVPPVAPNAGGPQEIVRDGVDGLLVDVERSTELVRAVLELVRDPARRAEMGREGRARATDLFTAERMAADAWRVAREAWLRRRPAGDAAYAADSVLAP